MWKQAAILGGLILGIVALAKYRLARSFDVLVKKIKFTGSLQAPKLLLTLGINNPTPYSATVQKISGKIYANDVLIATIDQTINTDIQPEKISDLQLDIDILPLGSIVSVLSYIGNKNFSLLIDGFIIVDGLPIPVKYKYDQ